MPTKLDQNRTELVEWRRASPALGASLAAGTAVRVIFFDGTQGVQINVRSLTTAVVAEASFCPYLSVLKTDDLLVTAPVDGSVALQNRDTTATGLALGSLDTFANGHFIMVGAKRKFAGVRVNMGAAVNTGVFGSVLAVNYWDGGAWADITPTDGTSVARSGAVGDATAEEDGVGFTDFTTEINEATDADVICFPATSSVDDAFYIGSLTQFSRVSMDRLGSVQGTGTPTTVWEYSQGGDVWAALTGVTDDTATAGIFGTAAVADADKLIFTVPSDWALQAVDGGTPHFFIRIRISVGNYTAEPTLSQAFIEDITEATFGADGDVTWTIPADWERKPLAALAAAGELLLPNAGTSGSKISVVSPTRELSLYWTRWEVSAQLDGAVNVAQMISDSDLSNPMELDADQIQDFWMRKGIEGNAAVDLDVDSTTGLVLVNCGAPDSGFGE